MQGGFTYRSANRPPNVSQQSHVRHDPCLADGRMVSDARSFDGHVDNLMPELSQNHGLVQQQSIHHGLVQPQLSHQSISASTGPFSVNPPVAHTPPLGQRFHAGIDAYGSYCQQQLLPNLQDFPPLSSQPGHFEQHYAEPQTPPELVQGIDVFQESAFLDQHQRMVSPQESRNPERIFQESMRVDRIERMEKRRLVYQGDRAKRSEEAAAFLNAKRGQQFLQESVVSNSMSIRELAALVEQLPEGADPFDLIYNTLRTPQDEPTAQTTVMMRNVPTKYTQRSFLKEIRLQGFDKCIDFLYLPSDSRGKGNVGYGFINFVTIGFLSEFKKDFTEKKFRLYPTPTPITILMSTTQGWRENLVKVIRNNVLKRQVAPEFLPLLFCRSTGQEYPFPVPSDVIPPPISSQTQLPASQTPYNDLQPQKPRMLVDHGDPPTNHNIVDQQQPFAVFEHQQSHQELAIEASSQAQYSTQNNRQYPGSSHVRQHPRDVSISPRDSNNSGNVIKRHSGSGHGSDGCKDPLAAFAGNAKGEDALSKHVSQASSMHSTSSNPNNQHRQHQQPKSSTSLPTNTIGFKLGSRDVAEFVPGSVGRYKTQPNIGTCATGSLDDSFSTGAVSEHSYDALQNKPGFTKGKVDDFYRFHGVDITYEMDHLIHITRLKLSKNCTSKDKTHANAPRFPLFDSGSGKGYKGSKGKGKGNKGIFPAVQPRTASSTLPVATHLTEVRSDVDYLGQIQRSHSATEFCAIDVSAMSDQRLQDKLRSTSWHAGSSDDADHDSFNAEIFAADVDGYPESPGLTRMWSNASASLEDLCLHIKSGQGDVLNSSDVESAAGSDNLPSFCKPVPSAAGFEVSCSEKDQMHHA